MTADIFELVNIYYVPMISMDGRKREISFMKNDVLR